MGLAAERLSEPVVLRYRPHLRWMYKLYLAIGYLMGGGALVLGAAIAYFEIRSAAYGGVGVLLFLAFEFWALARFMLGPLAQASVEVRPDGATLIRFGKRIEIPFSELKAMKTSSVPYLGGWFTLCLKSGKRYKFTVVLERSDLLLDAVGAARPDLYAAKRVLNYRRTAVFADQSWARLYEKARAWPSLLFKYLVVPAVVGAFVIPLATKFLGDKFGVGTGIAVGMLYSLLAVALYIGGEYVLAWRLRNRLKANPADVGRDPASERSVTAWLNGVYYLSAAAVATVSVLMGWL